MECTAACVLCKAKKARLNTHVERRSSAVRSPAVLRNITHVKGIQIRQEREVREQAMHGHVQIQGIRSYVAIQIDFTTHAMVNVDRC